MEESKKVYWKGIEQLANNPEFVKNEKHEFAQPGPEEDLGHSRRDFLKMMGFGMSAVTLAACEAPIRKAIPYVSKPMDTDPSIADFYASSYINGGEYCSILVKTREGRPIKIEGNALSKVTNGGTNAQVEASVLSLYDNDRLRGPKANGKRIDWADLDKEVIAKLNQVASSGGQIRIVANSILSPSTKAVLDQFRAKFPTAQLVQYDQVSAYGMLKANEESFGSAFIPSYDFSKANVIVGIGADFLGGWLSSCIEFSQQYGKTREVSEDKREMSRHYQFESVLSITGANADYRTQIKPSQEGAAVVALYNLLASKAGRPTVSGGDEKISQLSKAADDLWNSRGKALVVAGSNDKAVQVLVNAINEILGSYGTTINTSLTVNYKQGDDQAMANFLSDAEGGKLGAVIFYNCNPVYDYPAGDKLVAAIKKIELTIATHYKEDETGTLVNYLAPDHHFLESWNDAEPKKNHFSLVQPAITPIFKSRAAQQSFLTWAGEANADYFEFVKNNWRTKFFATQSGSPDFQSFWDKCLYDGVYDLPDAAPVVVTFAGDVNAAASAIASNYKPAKWEVVVYESGNIGNGSQANNPLLQELPDPITKVVWDHYVTVAPKDAKDISFSESFTKVASIKANGKTIQLPVMVQPGQAPGTIGIPLGYGRSKAGKVADGRGKNAYPLVGLVNGSLSYAASADFSITDEPYQLAQTQTHNTYMGRTAVVQETTLASFKSNPAADAVRPKISTWSSADHKADPETLSLWKNHDYKNHHWGMAIDLNTCTGCGSCIVACNVENNVALVGREEVIARREMHWLRIDRYYSSNANPDDWKGVEEASENPEVVFQPMLCQHCNNAPCETVCPVAATTHSTEGLNQMTYNRCIGTRYCANNCPYKVRRFNWFKYHDNRQFENVNPAMNTDLGKMVLNPDVTVRSRGVMEKCTFCVQRIQLGKLNARKERRKVQDGEVVTACQAACATGAIVFGDLNDPESKIAKLLKPVPLDKDRPTINAKEATNPRAYQALEEIGVRPNIWYLRKVRNKDAAKA
jgi:molybdopterin-containing oxidoreductase family iron-sulfur binding subunit